MAYGRAGIGDPVRLSTKLAQPTHFQPHAMDYSSYRTLAITRRGPGDTVLDIQMRALNGKLPTAGHEGHRELAQIWRDVAVDDSVRCAVLRGEGLGFSGGGDLALVADM